MNHLINSTNPFNLKQALNKLLLLASLLFLTACGGGGSVSNNEDSPTHLITTSSSANGKITATTSVENGGTTTITIMPDPGYEIDSLIIDEVAVTPSETYKFEDVVTGHKVVVTFKIKSFLITTSAGSNGSISDSTTVNYGSDLIVTITPENGYEIDTIMVDSELVSTVTSYSFTNITDTHTVAVTFKLTSINNYAITASTGANGAISPTGVVTVDSGATQLFTITPDNGYEIDAIVVDGTSTGNESLYSFTNVTANHTIVVTFKPLSSVTSYTSVVAGFKCTIALKSDGTLWTWGWNKYGQLGDGTTTDRFVPKQIGVAKYSKISSAGNHTVALKSDGSLWAWGDNSGGEIGDGTTTDSLTPVKIGSGIYTSISTGKFHTLALKSDGSLWAWGDNSSGELGDGTLVDKLVPTLITFP